jgi:hypothetical protein
MEFSNTAILILVMVWGVILTLAFAVGGGLILNFVADTRREVTHKAVPPGARGRRRRYEHSRITRQ